MLIVVVLASRYLPGWTLDNRGYLERRIDLDDVRSRRVHITERGTSTITVTRNAVAELERDWQSGMRSRRAGTS